jgi:hypothetical protein
MADFSGEEKSFFKMPITHTRVAKKHTKDLYCAKCGKRGRRFTKVGCRNTGFSHICDKCNHISDYVKSANDHKIRKQQKLYTLAQDLVNCSDDVVGDLFAML